MYYISPRGFAEANSSVFENAQRELFEECGVEAESCEFLGKVTPDSGLLAQEVNIIQINFTNDDITLETNEGINNYYFLSKEETMKMIADGKIVDAFTICAIMMAITKNTI